MEDGKPYNRPLSNKVNETLKKVVGLFNEVDHLNPEAIVAFVDGEMDANSAHRARVHFVHCQECRAEAQRVRNASDWVRGRSSEERLSAPADLISKLSTIADGKSGQESEVDKEFRLQGDLMDKVEMFVRAIKKNQRGNS